MKKLMIFFFMIILTLTLFSQTKANVKMLNGDTIPCEIETERLDLVTDYGELSFGTKFIKTIQFPEPGKGNTVLNTIFGETFRGFITNDIIELNVYGSLMKVRKAKINNIEFLNENQQATDYTIVISLRNGDTFYATPVDSIINIQTSYGEVKLPFENMAAISFEGFGNVLTKIEMKDGGILQGIIKDDYIPVKLLSEIELEIVPDLMKEIKFISVEEKNTIKDIALSEEDSNLLNVYADQLYQSKLEIVLVQSGSFQMGNTQNENKGNSDEKPVQTVNLIYDYYLGKTETTNKQYIAYLNDRNFNSNGASNGKEHIDMDDEDCEIGYRNGAFYLKEGDEQAPVIMITWWGAIGYCNWLSEKEGLAKAYDNKGNLLDKNGRQTTDITKVEGYRLPTEAEWEYAARGGHNSTSDYKYAGSNNIDTVAWYWDNSKNSSNPIYEEKGTHVVARKSPNELGFFDMSGNVWEWCHDWYDEYKNITQTNPIGPNYASFRVRRGGSWRSDTAEDCRVANRNRGHFTYSSCDTGMRIARTRK